MLWSNNLSRLLKKDQLRGFWYLKQFRIGNVGKVRLTPHLEHFFPVRRKVDHIVLKETNEAQGEIIRKIFDGQHKIIQFSRPIQITYISFKHFTLFIFLKHEIDEKSKNL